jgi:hypothetical protein
MQINFLSGTFEVWSRFADQSAVATINRALRVLGAYPDYFVKAWFKWCSNECDNLNRTKLIRRGLTGSFMSHAFFANCHIQLNHALFA